MLHLVVPGWARPHEMIGREASSLRLYGTTGEPCLFKHVSPRDIQQGCSILELPQCTTL